MMENRLLYLEKEVGHLRKKIARLELNVQEEMKNYIDEYLSVKLDEIVNSIAGKYGGTNSLEREATQQDKNSHADQGSTDFTQENISNTQNETCGVAVYQEPGKDRPANNIQCTSVMENMQDDTERDVTQFHLVDEDIIEIDDQNSSADGLQQQSDELLFSHDDIRILNEDVHMSSDASGMPQIRIGSTSVPNTSFYLPTIVSMAKEKATMLTKNGDRKLTLIPLSQVGAGAAATDNHNLNFDCPVCHERFKCASHLQKHSVKHMSDRPFKCEFCEKDYKRGHHLKEHQTLTHPEEKNTAFESGRRYRCLKCSKLFVRSSLLAAHSKVHSRDGGVIGGVIRYAVEQVKKVPTRVSPAVKPKLPSTSQAKGDTNAS